jgi:ABC-2 type transport system permease protein
MSIRRIGVLLGKEFVYGPKSFMFSWSLGFPIIATVLFTLIFGSFSEKPKLGIVDLGKSQITVLAKEAPSVRVKEYSTASRLRGDVERGALDVGVVVPEEFDETLTGKETPELTSYIWGESLAKNRTIVNSVLTSLVRELLGKETPVDIEAVSLGEEKSMPWNDRLLPFIVLICVFFGGIVLTASSIIDEKEKRTFVAVSVTPATITDIFVSKGILGAVLSLTVGILTLLINQAFGAHPGLLVLLLALGGVMAVSIGLILGALVKDLTTLLSIWKLGGILLFGPAIVYMFPGIPQWIGKIFPTYYLTQPIVSISQFGAGWTEISTNTFILMAIDAVMLGLVVFFVSRARERQLSL